MKAESVVLRGGVACLAVLLVGCASADKTAYSAAELRAVVGARVPRERAGDVLVPYAVTAEMTERAEEYTRHHNSDYARAQALVRAVTDKRQFNVKWEAVTTAVARETFEKGHGNCLSLTSLFVGLARSIGLNAYYVDASDRVNDLTRDDELLVDTGHIAASVRTERGWSLVDFTGEISHYRTFRVIDDLEALAHFYNNRGYELIRSQRGDGEAVRWERALEDFTMAAYVQPDFSRALNNQGVALSRLGREAEAEQAYLRAVAADDEFGAPRHNLGNLHLRRGELEQAIRWYGVAARMQPKNPYLQYHLGLARYQAGDIDGSVEAFERAIALKQDYLEPRNLLAQAYRQQGRTEEADKVQRVSGRQAPEGRD